jgi:predicted NACHT family NTPase
LPLVDGVDEMDPAGDRLAGRAAKLIRALNEWMAGRQRAPVVVTCRRAEYQELDVKLDRATHVEMVPLTASEAALRLDRGLPQRQNWTL